MAKKSRRLWLEIKYHAPGATKSEVVQTLISSIKRGDYSYPRNWLVGIYWSNSETADFRSGEFGKEMRASRQSSPGWDYAVLNYLMERR